jgi:hypothetical protein
MSKTSKQLHILRTLPPRFPQAAVSFYPPRFCFIIAIILKSHAYNLQDGFAKSFLYLRDGFDCEIVCTTHPLAYLGFLLVEHGGEVFLTQTTLLKDGMDTINNEEGKVNPPAYFRRHFRATGFYDATSFHRG